MRLFLAFELDEAARDAAAGVAGDLSGRLARARAPRAARWVARDNLHVTLRFLGEVDDPRADPLRRVLGEPLGVPPFALELGGGGCFPPFGPPRVVWIGVSRGAESARAVFARLDERLAPLGFSNDARQYTPHVTLGRVRDLQGSTARELRGWLAGTPAAVATIAVRDVVLYRSHLGPQGSQYEVVQRTKLIET
jgi:2'-5' RNA ligase